MYFFDTYAIIEMQNSNPNYLRFVGTPIIGSVYNKTELFYSNLADKGEKEAKARMEKANMGILEIKDEDIIDACKFRLKHKAKKLSYADCIGYTLAKRNNLKFLTGDNMFKGMENVEFVK